jgi:teichuronic acid biosynthesis glycosyltransferase TuaH
VVATRTLALGPFGDTVYIADKPADYPVLLDQALAEDDDRAREKRIALARTHTWENSVGEIYSAIDNFVSN